MCLKGKKDKKVMCCGVDSEVMVIFYYRSNDTEVRGKPSILNAKVVCSSGEYKWVFFQTKRENIPGKHNEFTIDRDPLDQARPPYYSWYDGPYKGKEKAHNYSDIPCYNYNKAGKIVFYTIFGEILESNSDPKKQKYAFKCGVTWGIEKDNCEQIKSIPISTMSIKEKEDSLNLLQESYKDAHFELSGNSVNWFS
jgi:hypothetical protein